MDNSTSTAEVSDAVISNASWQEFIDLWDFSMNVLLLFMALLVYLWVSLQSYYDSRKMSDQEIRKIEQLENMNEVASDKQEPTTGSTWTQRLHAWVQLLPLATFPILIGFVVAIFVRTMLDEYVTRTTEATIATSIVVMVFMSLVASKIESVSDSVSNLILKGIVLVLLIAVILVRGLRSDRAYLYESLALIFALVVCIGIYHVLGPFIRLAIYVLAVTLVSTWALLYTCVYFWAKQQQYNTDAYTHVLVHNLHCTEEHFCMSMLVVYLALVIARFIAVLVAYKYFGRKKYLKKLYRDLKEKLQWKKKSDEIELKGRSSTRTRKRRLTDRPRSTHLTESDNETQLALAPAPAMRLDNELLHQVLQNTEHAQHQIQALTNQVNMLTRCKRIVIENDTDGDDKPVSNPKKQKPKGGFLRPKERLLQDAHAQSDEYYEDSGSVSDSEENNMEIVELDEDSKSND